MAHMTPDDTILMPGSQLTEKGDRRVEALDASTVAALATGAAESTNPKLWLCEDSLAVHRLEGGGRLAVVADSHYGGYAGEAVVRPCREEFETLRAEEPGRRVVEILTDVLRRLDLRLHEGRPPGDESETTALLVYTRGRTVHWVSVGDSYAMLCGQRTRILNQESFENWPRFVGGPPLSVVAPTGLPFDHDMVEARPGEVLLLATDGIETRSSGMELAEIAPIMSGDAPLEARLRELLGRCDRPETGGGRDNLGLVALDLG